MSPMKNVKRLLTVLGAALLLTGCKGCGGSTDGGGYASPTPIPRALSR